MTSLSFSPHNYISRILYDSASCHLSFRSPLEIATEEVFRSSLEVAKFESEHLYAGPPEINPQTVLSARSRRLNHVLLPLKGPYSVGHTCLVIKGPKNGDETIDIEIYAPSRKSAGDKLLMHLRPDVGPRPDQCLGKVLSTEQLHTLHTHSLDRIDSVGKMPCLIFSHGWGVIPSAYRPLLEELASHGYVILGVHHSSSSTEDGSKTPKSLAIVQSNNLRFIIDQIQNGTLKKVRDIIFSDQIILAGHSMGGDASTIVSRRDASVLGCINLDGSLSTTDGVEMPVLMIFSDHLKHEDTGSQEEQERFRSWKKNEYSLMLQNWKTFYDNSLERIKIRGLGLEKISRTGKIEGSNHMNFSVLPLLSWLVGEKTLEGALKTHLVASQEMLRFMHAVCGVK